MLEWRENVLAYARTDQNQRIVVIINNSDALEEVTVPVWQAEIPMRGRMRCRGHTGICHKGFKIIKCRKIIAEFNFVHSKHL